MNERHRVQLELGETGMQKLEQLKDQTGATSGAEVCRKALHWYEWLIEQARHSRTVQVEEADGKLVTRQEARWML